MAEKLLAAVSAVSTDDSEETLVGKCNLGEIKKSRGKCREAEELETRVIEAREKALGSGNLLTLASIVILARTCSEQERYQEAKALQLEVVEDRKEILGERQTDTLNELGALAVTCSKLGDMNEVKKYARVTLGM